ncbi:macrophage mannose receptor 1-like isoform X3 [Hydra vulgaris]|uniref:Macrophage mannose receptor 1-like isoform X3 n=1 Tax=Hydra vulgaris TaxID=6087 RepID=A0ABM4B7J6_HYDVU
MLSMLIVSQHLILYYLFCCSTSFITLTTARILTAKASFNATCSNGWSKYGKNCYFFYSKSSTLSGKNWSDSLLWCLNNGGNLLSVADHEENVFILNNLKNENMKNKRFWIGLNALQRTFVWSDNTPSLFFNWRQGEPNIQLERGNCVEVNPYGWNDHVCDSHFGFICKIKKGTFGTGCSNESYEYSSYCYSFHGNVDHEGVDWHSALYLCSHMGGNLLSITNQAENLFILNHLKNDSMKNQHFWIGLNALKRIFAWSDNTTSLFLNWTHGQPDNFNENELCSEITTDGWNDISCDNSFGFICKTKQGPDNVNKMCFIGTNGPEKCFDDDNSDGHTWTLNPKCPNGWSQNAEYCYMYQSSVKNYQDSLSSCQSYKGSLLSVKDQEENAFISNYIISNNLQNTSIWIGLHDNKALRKFEWSDGTPLSYTNWKNMEPSNFGGNEHCVEISNAGWNDINCGNSLSYICKLKIVNVKCPNGWLKNAGYCYLYQNSTKNYQDSLLSCQSYGGSLLSVEDQVENAYILNFIISNNLQSITIWIGLHDNEALRKFEWLDGTPLSYTNWRANEPNNLNRNEHCVEISKGGWNDNSCEKSFCYICKLKIVNLTCPGGWIQSAAYCYLYQYSPKNYQDSLLSCQSYGGNLLSVEDQVENEFILSFIIGNNLVKTSTWIGLNDIKAPREFRWSDGTPLSYTNWKINEPFNLDGNEHCVELSSGGWNDTDCGKNFSYICKLKIKCNGTCSHFSTCINNKCQCLSNYSLINGICTDMCYAISH